MMGAHNSSLQADLNPITNKSRSQSYTVRKDVYVLNHFVSSSRLQHCSSMFKCVVLQNVHFHLKLECVAKPSLMAARPLN